MNSNNSKTTSADTVDYQELLKNALRTKNIPAKKIIDNVCLFLTALTQDCAADISNFNVDISIIGKRLDDPEKKIELEDLDKLSRCFEALKAAHVLNGASFIKNLDQWIEQKQLAILKHREFEVTENHYKIDYSSNKVQDAKQEETTVSSNDDDLEGFEVIETLTEVVGEVAGTDEDFVLL